jgi:DnaJ family protein C protein 28
MMDRPKNWESWIERQILEAQERGDFDNLPGMGVPLDLTPNPYALDQELAFKILKDAGCAPEWIELDKSIRGELEDARTTLRHQWVKHQARLEELEGRSDRWAQAQRDRSQARWQRAMTTFEGAVTTINERIGNYNLKVPSPRFQRTKLDVVLELDRLQGSSA